MYGYSTKKWEISFAGVLANEGEVSTGRNPIIMNKNNTLQFYIRIISTPPDSFPRQVKDVCCYVEELKNWGFIDDVNKSDIERIMTLNEWLNNYIFFFKVELKKPSSGNEYHIARDVHVMKKSDSFQSSTLLEAIPIFSEETSERTQDLFEQQLGLGKHVGDNKQISKDIDDTPSMILWKKNPKNPEYKIYGLFEKHDHAHGGFRFHTSSEQVYSVNLQMEYLMESYLHDHVLFIDSKYYNEIMGLLEEHGEPLTDSDPTNAEEQVNMNYDSESSSTYEEKTPLSKEEDFMKIFEQECIRNGLYYDQKDLYNFHTAMKTGGLVILAGMSGTGKSKLIRCYADALSLGKEQLLFVPVRPFWQDDADVIGYLDTLHNVYQPGDSGVVNILNRAKDYYEELHIICFDEMNLARVEHYFSQFLSVLEQDENKRVLRLYNDEYASRIYNQNIFNSTILVGNNVLFVGTVNLDESTYQFSDKVLDRANVITLNMKSYADEFQTAEQVKADAALGNKRKNEFNFDTYKTFKSKERDISLTENERKLLWDLHNELQGCNKNLGIGWRIIRQMSHFLDNIPPSAPLTREESFDIQLVQRVLTKVRGSDEQFIELIGHYDSQTKQVEESKLLNMLSSMPSSYKFERTRKMVMEKSKELQLYGHTV